MVLTSAVKKVLTHGAVICLNYDKMRFLVSVENKFNLYIWQKAV